MMETSGLFNEHRLTGVLLMDRAQAVLQAREAGLGYGVMGSQIGEVVSLPICVRSGAFGSLVAGMRLCGVFNSSLKKGAPQRLIKEHGVMSSC
jgi:hypothetical protein